MSLRIIKPIVSVEGNYRGFRIVANDYGEARDELVLTHKKGRIDPIVIQLAPCTKLTYADLKSRLESGPTRYQIVSRKKIIEEANTILETMRNLENYSSYKERYAMQGRPKSSLE